MAGLLRKLAGLVVEFPDDPAASTSHKAGGGSADDGEDVVSAIEKIRSDLETSTSLDPKKLAEADKAAATKEDAAAASEPGSGGASSGLPAIRLPIVLNITQVYEKAELPAAPGGFDLQKVSAMLSDPEIADLPLDVRARSVRMAVRSAGGDLAEVLGDAARRDQALEVYEDYLARRIDEIKQQVAAQNGTLEQEIQDFIAARRAIIESNKAKLESAQQALKRYSEDKQAEEQRLFDTVAPFVAPGENPVVKSGMDGLPKPGGAKE